MAAKTNDPIRLPKLHKKPHKFADLALKHSECPTAPQGGAPGFVPRGKLYPELDAVLFKLKASEISDAVESEIGFHLVLCNQIQKPETLSARLCAYISEQKALSPLTRRHFLSIQGRFLMQSSCRNRFLGIISAIHQGAANSEVVLVLVGVTSWSPLSPTLALKT